MFEIVQVLESGEFYNRVFPILLPDAQIYDPVQRLKYIRYWEEKKRELNEEMKGVGAEYLQGIREAIDRYTCFRNTIAQLTDNLSNMNTLTSELHLESNFEVLLNEINSRLSEITLEESKPPSPQLNLDTPIDYTKLISFLQARKWVDADKESLRAFLKAANREQQGWLRLEDFGNLPNNVVCTVDHLWTKYSSGRFGLSVQSKIWDSTVSQFSKDSDVIGNFCRACGAAERRRGAIGLLLKDNVLALHFLTAEEIYSKFSSVSWIQIEKPVSCLSQLFSNVKMCK
jgi:hypothetical protein